MYQQILFYKYILKNICTTLNNYSAWNNEMMVALFLIKKVLFQMVITDTTSLFEGEGCLFCFA